MGSIGPFFDVRKLTQFGWRSSWIERGFNKLITNVREKKSVLPAINPFAFDQPVYSGDDVQVTCYVARGDEPISMSWTLNGQPLTNSRPGVNLVNVGSKTSLLTISNVNHHSDGEYRCLARNPAGEVSFSANLTVYGKGWDAKRGRRRPSSGTSSASSAPLLNDCCAIQSRQGSCRSISATSRSPRACPLTPSAPPRRETFPWRSTGCSTASPIPP